MSRKERISYLESALTYIQAAENWKTTTFPNGETETSWCGQSWPKQIARDAMNGIWHPPIEENP